MGKLEQLVVVPEKGNFYISMKEERIFDIKFFPNHEKFQKNLIGQLISELPNCIVIGTPECFIYLEKTLYSKLIEQFKI